MIDNYNRNGHNSTFIYCVAVVDYGNCCYLKNIY